MFEVSIKEAFYNEAAKFSMAAWLQLVDKKLLTDVDNPVLRRLMAVYTCPNLARLEAHVEVLHSQKTTMSTKTLVRIFARAEKGEPTDLISAVVDVPHTTRLTDGSLTEPDVVAGLVRAVVWHTLSWLVTIRGPTGVGYLMVNEASDLKELDAQLGTGWFVDTSPPADRREHVALKIEAFSLQLRAKNTPK